MFYPFPYIKHIDQVREALHGREEFIITEKAGGFTVANYLVNFEDTFPEIKLNEQGQFATKEDELYAIRRECRGLKFNTKTGLVAQRLYHKFFNYGEKAETQLIDLADYVSGSNAKLLEKLDGSMISPIQLEDRIGWTTKMGETEVALLVKNLLDNNPQYEKLARNCIDTNHTPIFEFCSRKQRIVIDYPEEMLVLTAIRENYSGRYLSITEIQTRLDNLGIKIPVVKRLFVHDLIKMSDADSAEQLEKDLADIKSTNGILNIIRQKQNVEGYVLRLDNGHMLKLKADDYVRIHKAKEGLRFEKDVIDLIVNEKIDDIKPVLSGDELKRVNDFETAFWHGFQQSVNLLGDMYDKGKVFSDADKKKFATEYVSKQEQKFRPLLFQMWNGEPGAKIPEKAPHTVLLDVIKKKLGSSTMVEEVRWIFNANWSYSIINE